MTDWIQAQGGKETIREDSDAVIRRLIAKNKRLTAERDAAMAALGPCARAILIEDENGPTSREALLNDLRHRQAVALAALEQKVKP